MNRRHVTNPHFALVEIYEKIRKITHPSTCPLITLRLKTPTQEGGHLLYNFENMTRDLHGILDMFGKYVIENKMNETEFYFDLNLHILHLYLNSQADTSQL